MGDSVGKRNEEERMCGEKYAGKVKTTGRNGERKQTGLEKIAVHPSAVTACISLFSVSSVLRFLLLVLTASATLL